MKTPERQSWLGHIRRIVTPREVAKFSVLYKLFVFICIMQGCNYDEPEDIDPELFLSRMECAEKKCGVEVPSPGGGAVEGVPVEFFDDIEDIPAWARALLQTKIAVNSQLCDGEEVKCGRVIDLDFRIWYNVTLEEWCTGDPEDEEDKGYIEELDELAQGDGSPYVVSVYGDEQVFGDARCE